MAKPIALTVNDTLPLREMDSSGRCCFKRMRTSRVVRGSLNLLPRRRPPLLRLFVQVIVGRCICRMSETHKRVQLE